MIHLAAATVIAWLGLWFYALVAMVCYGAIMLGGGLSVLPLPVLPFRRAQTPAHYFSHAVFAAAQLPLMILSLARLRIASCRSGARGGAVTPSVSARNPPQPEKGRR
jgi:hypothetical protein